MNKDGTPPHIRAKSVPDGMTPFEKRQARREKREAKAIAILHAMKPKPVKPEIVLRHTELSGELDAPGCVYFAYCAGRIKIGYTTEVADRMRALATSSPFPVTLLLTVRGTPADEVRYHAMFADDRRHLEWFDLSHDLLDFLSAQFGYGTHELLWNAEDEYDEAKVMGTPPVWLDQHDTGDRQRNPSD